MVNSQLDSQTIVSNNKKMKILLLSGGSSSEREVSLRSANSVKDALVSNGHTVDEYDPALGLDGLRQYVGKVDVVFPVLHGRQGEDGEVQQALESLGLPFVGANAAVSKLCFDKHRFNQAIYERGFIIPLSQLVDRQQFDQSSLIRNPFVLKPVDGGSSIDTLIVANPGQNQSQVDELFHKYPQLLLQELIVGTEITVAVLGNEALPVIEIIPPQGEEFDYENKYNGKTQEICPPLSVSREHQVVAQQIALDIHQQLGVRHFSRTDMMIDQTGNIFVLELNTIPGLTEASLFPKAAKAAGIDMVQLVEQLVQMAVAK